jgi:hypothetical protein
MTAIERLVELLCKAFAESRPASCRDEIQSLEE